MPMRPLLLSLWGCGPIVTVSPRLTGQTMNEPERADILLIDDDAAIRTLLLSALETRGYSVRWAADGKTALQLLSSHGFRLIITDIFMPDMDGLELIMRNARTSPHTPILVISGGGIYCGPVEILKSARHLGGSKTLEKPFAIADFFASVSELLADEMACVGQA